MSIENKKKIVSELISKGILVSPDLMPLTKNEDGSNDAIFNNIDKAHKSTYINKDLFELLSKEGSPNLNWDEFEKTKAIFELTGDSNTYCKFIDYLGSCSEENTQKSKVNIVSSYEEESSKKEVNDFTMYFNARLDSLQKILSTREELKSITSVSRILAKRDRETVSLIGIVTEKRITKNGNIMVTLEDSTGEIKVLINKNKPEIYDPAKDLVLDEVIGISGVNGDNIVFANVVIWPDIPVSNKLKVSKEEGYALFLSDVHVGSKNFLEEDFTRFLKWLNGETGNEKQKEISSKVKYIFIAGDLVDGVGVYPGQEEDLKITDIYEQYKECMSLFSKIPRHIEVIVCAGNHDALRLAEPQPPIYNEFCKELENLPNITTVSNPALVNIHSSEDFEGYNVLLYHGYSFDYYVANVDSIRNNGGYDRADLIMKFLLKRRHLAPTHTSTLYIPYTDKDPLVISTVPDFFVTGHIHKSSVAHYKNVTLICGSCWQSKTDFQEKVGHHPEPSRVPLVNLQTREVKILKFGK